MSFKKRVIPALVASALILGTPSAQAIQFSGVYIFGDSLSDAGFYRPGLVALLGSAAAAGVGRFTSNPGPVWSELIAQYYGGNAAPSNAGGGIYAQGGMQVTGNAPASRVGPGGTQRPMATQISEYLASSGGSANPNALYGVWLGANDIFTLLEGLQTGAVTAAQLPTIVPAIAAAEVGQIARLQAAGARYILVFNIPAIGATPAFAGNAQAAATVTGLSNSYNTSLYTSLKAANLKVIPVDVAALTAEVRANASAYGFTNVTTPACLPIGSSALACSAANFPTGAANSYLYADGVHPTTASTAIVADFVKSLIDGPNAYSMMAEVPLSSRAAHVRTLDEGLQSGQAAAVGKVVAFAAGDSGKSDFSGTIFSPQSNTKNRAAAVGLTMRASEALTVGVAVGTSTADTNLGGAGRFDLDETALSLFASLKSAGFYGTIIATSSDLKFKGVQRVVKLGIVNRVASASTKGSNVSATYAAGYDFNLGKVSAGPFASITSQTIDVANFTESGAGSADLNILRQDRRSRVVSFGLRASVALGNWVPYARVSKDKEQIDDDRFVSANPVSVAAGLTYDIPAYKPDSSWVTGTIGIRGKITERIGVSVAYSKVSSKQNLSQDGVTAGVAFGF